MSVTVAAVLQGSGVDVGSGPVRDLLWSPDLRRGLADSETGYRLGSGGLGWGRTWGLTRLDPCFQCYGPHQALWCPWRDGSCRRETTAIWRTSEAEESRAHASRLRKRRSRTAAARTRKTAYLRAFLSLDTLPGSSGALDPVPASHRKRKGSPKTPFEGHPEPSRTNRRLCPLGYGDGNGTPGRETCGLDEVPATRPPDPERSPKASDPGPRRVQSVRQVREAPVPTHRCREVPTTPFPEAKSPPEGPETLLPGTETRGVRETPDVRTGRSREVPETLFTGLESTPERPETFLARTGTRGVRETPVLRARHLLEVPRVHTCEDRERFLLTKERQYRVPENLFLETRNPRDVVGEGRCRTSEAKLPGSRTGGNARTRSRSGRT